jgi:hypothetical protein
MSNLSPVEQQLVPNQQPLGTQFKSYELNKAVNYYLLDPFQYAITKFDYADPDVVPGAISQIAQNISGRGNNCAIFGQKDYKNDPGLVYKDVNFELLLPAYTATKKSVNDFPAQSYHRFTANEGYFNPNEGNNNTDLWYYGAAENRFADIGLTGAPLNVQEVNHIIFPEPQRGGLNSTNLAKYSWVNTQSPKQMYSWEARNTHAINNNQRCEFFNYNNTYSKNFNGRPVDEVYSFDSNYCRSIGISSPTSGSMPFSN